MYGPYAGLPFIHALYALEGFYLVKVNTEEHPSETGPPETRYRSASQGYREKPKRLPPSWPYEGEPEQAETYGTRINSKRNNGWPGWYCLGRRAAGHLEPGPGRESRKSWKLLKFLIAYKAEGVFNICFWRVGNNGYIHGKTSFQSYLCYQYMYKLAEGDMPGAFTRRRQWQKGRLPGFCPALPSFESFPVCINRRALWSVLYRRDCISVPCI